jgi:high affinity Mn2+ porin
MPAAIAEMGDRTQLLARVLAVRYRRPIRTNTRIGLPRSVAAFLPGSLVLVLACGCALAADAPGGSLADAAEPKEVAAEIADIEQRFAVHAQATYGQQWTNAFNAPYAGTNSLSPSSSRETADSTLFLGARLWRGAEIWITPEIDQGFGLDDTLGVAGFPSGLAYKVGAHDPYFRLPRAFVRQTINAAGLTEAVEGLANQLAGSHSGDRWVITLGKFAVTDVFDTNRYAHDPRADFLNWAVIDTGTFDYAADSWGYTVGIAIERYIGAWTFRAGLFDLSDVPNSEALEHGFHEFQLVGEIERRYILFGQTGRVLVTGFDSRGRMALLQDAINLALATDTTPGPAAVRQYRSRTGIGVSLEQPISSDLGVFARVGKGDGNTEVYEFTDIDRTVALGASLRGTRWQRPSDTVGVALVDNGISAVREQYLNLGGLGILVGDGKLPHPGAEQILETYYSLGTLSWLHVTADYQWVKNPAYNTDRGPVSIFGLRIHAQF